MKLSPVATGLAGLCLAACVTHPGDVTVLRNYTSTPAGAEVLRNGVVIGRAPLARFESESWTTLDANGRRVAQCTDTEPVTFRWASGAEATADLCQGVTRVSATRPEDAPGIEQDLKVASRHEKTRQPTPLVWVPGQGYGVPLFSTGSYRDQSWSSYYRSSGAYSSGGYSSDGFSASGRESSSYVPTVIHSGKLPLPPQ